MLILVILYQIFYSHNFNCNLQPIDDKDKYCKAYYFIKNSQIFKKAYAQYDELNVSNVCTSKQIITTNEVSFMDEILDFEYFELNNSQKDSLKNIMRQREYKNQIVIDSSINLTEMKNSDSCQFLIFFSEIENNRLFATIEINSDNSYDYNYIHRVLSPVAVNYLIYFYNGNIQRVFSNIVYR